MPLFETEFVHKAKPTVVPHPWEKRIKYIYSNNIKYPHNSINNPYYPKKETKEPDEKLHRRYVFTVIGNRNTKEFIYSVKLVQGIYKYRSKIFDPPIVKGFSATEWPIEWKNLKIKYGSSANCLLTQVAVLFNDKFLGGDEELKRLIEERYIYHLCLDYQKEAANQFIHYVKASGRPCVYMHISVDYEPIGTLIFQLYSDLLPNTCENFIRLCKARKGGYSGTPVHRIVKDGWIQCGGFALKKSNLNCENFIVPHDKRGVLCMANDGRDIDCSTQFFVILQPASWMEHKYVAFGQLIDGEYTLQKIENVPTWYESPIARVTIFKCGILNFDCLDIKINPHARWYINKHIEDLVSLGEFLMQHLMEKVFLEIEFQRQRQKESDDTISPEISTSVHHKISKDTESSSSLSSNENYFHSKNIHESMESDLDKATASSIEAKEQTEKPYYLPMTDLPYDSDVDSVYDIKKFLKGDYCLESDLPILPKETKRIILRKITLQSELILPNVKQDEHIITFPEDLDSDDEEEIQSYFRNNVDRISFAGDVIRNIGNRVGMLNIFENSRKSELISFNDEALRRLRQASLSAGTERRPTQSDDQIRNRIKKLKELDQIEDWKEEWRQRDKKVSIAVTQDEEKIAIKMKQISISRDEEIKKGRESLQEEEKQVKEPKVQIVHKEYEREPKNLKRRPTGYHTSIELAKSDNDIRKSRLSHLYSVPDNDSTELPTLKNYKSHMDTKEKPFFLVSQDNQENRISIPYDTSIDHMMQLHGKRLTDAISPDDKPQQWKNQRDSSLRSNDRQKARPSLTVSEYQQKNKQLRLSMKTNTNVLTQTSSRGLRLPGDTPLFLSEESFSKVKENNKRTPKTSVTPVQRKPLQERN